ncbi:hypothetical protein HDU79_002991 [Rhizoclosmatium sp. JEL0117]|nr:hypothetical protein HDU79_002991 [Rhizoclosmatium sp. JEL0117]
MSQSNPLSAPKFFGFNTPNLHLIEDAVPWAIPTQFEVNDALISLLQAGCPITRIYPLAIGFGMAHITSSPYSEGNWTRIPGTGNPNLYANDELFKALDQAISSAGDLGVKIIFPFIDQADWWGGVPVFAEMHYLTADRFYTDPTVISNFMAVVRYVVTRNNTVSGIQYRNDPAIYAWETGNELAFKSSSDNKVPSVWTLGLAKLLKHGLNVKQYVIDGSDSKYGWNADVIRDPLIDGFTGHYYQLSDEQLASLGTWKSISLAGSIACLVLGVSFFVAMVLSIFKPSWFGIKTEKKTLFSYVASYSKGGKREVSRKLWAVATFSLLLVFTIATFSAAAALHFGTTLGPGSYASQFIADHDLIVTQNKKLFYVGEFGLSPLKDLQELLVAVNSSQALGALLWSFRFHSRNGGFWNHIEEGDSQSYHLPGFDVNKAIPGEFMKTGFGNDERAVVDLIKNYADNNGAPKDMQYYQKPPVGEPVLFPPDKFLNSSSAGKMFEVNFKWRGSTGARNYIVERAAGNVTNDFRVLYSGISDAVASGIPMLSDQLSVGNVFSYRVRGVNEFGTGPYSNVVVVSV